MSVIPRLPEQQNFKGSVELRARVRGWFLVPPSSKAAHPDGARLCEVPPLNQMVLGPALRDI